MLFSVVVRVLDVAGVTHLAATAVRWVLSPLKMSTAIIPSLMSGTFEITLGTEIASRAAAPLSQRAIAASAIIAWSGLSVFAQVAAMLHGTDMHEAISFREAPSRGPGRSRHQGTPDPVPAILGASALPEGARLPAGLHVEHGEVTGIGCSGHGPPGTGRRRHGDRGSPRPTQHRRR